MNGRSLSFALGKLHEAPIYIDETGGLSPANLRARARRLARQYGGKLGLLVIDYIQLMSGNTAGREPGDRSVGNFPFDQVAGQGTAGADRGAVAVLA